jgi:hypothetical protein
MSTLLQLRDNVFLRLAEASGATFSDGEVTNMINREYEFVQNEINMKDDEFFAKISITSTTGIEDDNYALPTDLAKLLLIEYKIPTSVNEWSQVPKISVHRRNEYRNRRFWSYNEVNMFYYLIGSDYYLTPNPVLGTDNLRITYIFIATPLADDIDVPQYPSTFHEILEIGAANRLRKSVKEPAIDEGDYAKLISRLIDTIEPRVKHNPVAVRFIGGTY